MSNKKQLSCSLALASDKTNIAHNNRDEKETNLKKNKHIDKDRIKENVTLKKKPIRELYDEEFGEVLEKYNNKQTRNDRKIPDYYEHIKNSKREIEQREFIVQFGSLEDLENGNISREDLKDMLEEYYDDFQERNPNLKIYNAVIHMDEATPHLHMNFVPVAGEYKRGMDKQVGFDRALVQQDSSLDKSKPFTDWRDKEVKVMEEIMSSRDIERKKVGTHSSMSVDRYKEVMDRERKADEVEKTNQKITESLNNKEKKVNDRIKQGNKQVEVIRRVKSSLEVREKAVEEAEKENADISAGLDVKALEVANEASRADEVLKEAKDIREKARIDREVANRMLKRSEELNERTLSIYRDMKDGQDINHDLSLLDDDLKGLTDSNIEL